MKTFENFYIENYKVDKNIIYFNFSFDKKIYFQESLDFGKKIPENIENLISNLHIALGISYFKLYPFANFNFPVLLNDKQIKFWKKFYINGLGEFFFKNKIKPKINFINGKKEFKKNVLNIDSQKAFLLWGGGKDSIVSYSLIKDNNDFTPFIVGKFDKIKEDTLNIIGKKPIVIKRQLDSKLFGYNKIYYNGHIPITGIISFISLLSAKIYNFGYIFTSNEKSASEENIIWEGVKINHQYSKSKEFENDFNQYNKYFIRGIRYKSLLSDFYEIEIAEKFSKLKEFFPYFSSCNKNFTISKDSLKNKRWCGKCEKCAFVYLILSPFIEEKKLIEIFGKNLFEDKDLIPTYKKLIGEGIKPFECVGTYNESKKALKLVLEKYNGKKLPIVLEKLKNFI